jgi:signal transduction histidine kinase
VEQYANRQRVRRRGSASTKAAASAAYRVSKKNERVRRAAKQPRTPSDTPIEATPEELATIRAQLGGIEHSLATLFGGCYARGPRSERSRHEAADIVESNFNAIVAEWTVAIRDMLNPYPIARNDQIPENCTNALIRFIQNLRDRDDLTTYVYLRRHCQEGMLSRVKPSEFNVLHIALKQIILQRVRPSLKGRHMERVRDAVVSAIDERRLMVSQFYIESRERALRISEEKYRNSIDHAPDPMYEIEPHTWMVLGANAAAEQLHRIVPGQHNTPLVGRRLLELGPPEERPHILKHAEKVVREGSDQILDWPLAGRYFDVNSALISFGNHRFVHMILHDVTQRREMLDELLRAERLAAAGTFAAGVAHEVNNPLASISSLVQSLLPQEQDSTRRTTLHTILGQITRISGTLKDLVNFARPAPAQRTRVDLNPLVIETLRLVGYNNRFHGISFKPELDTNLRAAFADSNEIQQVLINLLFNAADATQREGGTIRIVTENQAGRDNGGRIKKIVMRVSDNGIGIPAEHLNRVFDPFFTTKPAGAGVGLGLSLCQRIILANHGTIRIESELGKGTAVTICLPLYEGDDAAAGVEAQ